MDKGQLLSAECGRLGITDHGIAVYRQERAIRLPYNGRKMSNKNRSQNATS